MPFIAGFGPDGPIYITPAKPKAGVASAVVKIAPATGTTLTDQGLVVARIATLNAIDLQGDVTLPGAVGSGQDVVIGQWNHGSYQPGQLPAGKGRVTEEGNYLVVRGRFFLDTTAGRETFYTLRGLITSPWSYGFQIAEADRGAFQGELVRFLKRLVISEASPVMTAAGLGTGTTHLSSLDPRQIMVAGWAADNERRLRELLGWTRLRRELVGHFDGAPVYATGGRK